MGYVIWRWCFLVAFLLSSSMVIAAKQTYIVHMRDDQKPLWYATHGDWYSAHLKAVASADSDSILYAYTAACSGFAAWLDPEQAESLRRSDSVLAVYEDSVYSLHTTRTPEFLGLEPARMIDSVPADTFQELNRASEDIVIGLLDTGVWPESKSFDDAGMPDVPSRWRGKCDFSSSLCNKKLIGARAFNSGARMAAKGNNNNPIALPPETDSPRDQEGHGTHTASTAAGSPVTNASLFGYAAGTARGMATRARVAAYKVCWEAGCYGSDILAAIDQAIDDGVDVLSLSIGGDLEDYSLDPVAQGAFAAMENGIFVSCSAGNSGPDASTVTNVAPWIMTVGAGTLDRDFPAHAVLGNGHRFRGVSLYSGRGMGHKQISLVYNNDSNSQSNLCLPGSLKPELVRGKVVVCDRGLYPRVSKGAAVKEAGGVGMILANTAENGEVVLADSHLIPAVAVGSKVGEEIKEYVRSHVNPTALLSFRGTILNVRPAPVVAGFSSRGPNGLTPQILKPDVIGPGVNILAAWSEATGPTGANDTRRTKFNIISGTSMSCPHISGLAALLKAAHPGWSPSAIKSALMTTAYTRDNYHSPILDAIDYNFSTPFAYGSGHVDLRKALSPGLVYDISTEDYCQFICSLDYTLPRLRAFVRRSNFTCPKRKKFHDLGQLNYPSFSVVFNNSRVVRYTRELTNVDNVGSAYRVSVEGPSMVAVTVKPARLAFKKRGDKLRYTVTFVAKKGAAPVGGYAFGSLVWSDRQHQVKSPIAYSWT